MSGRTAEFPVNFIRLLALLWVFTWLAWAISNFGYDRQIKALEESCGVEQVEG